VYARSTGELSPPRRLAGNWREEKETTGACVLLEEEEGNDSDDEGGGGGGAVVPDFASTLRHMCGERGKCPFLPPFLSPSFSLSFIPASPLA